MDHAYPARLSTVELEQGLDRRDAIVLHTVQHEEAIGRDVHLDGPDIAGKTRIVSHVSALFLTVVLSNVGPNEDLAFILCEGHHPLALGVLAVVLVASDLLGLMARVRCGMEGRVCTAEVIEVQVNGAGLVVGVHNEKALFRRANLVLKSYRQQQEMRK